MTNEAFDPVTVLKRNTDQGRLSEIGYDKGDGAGVSLRVIEPRSLVEGASGLLVRSIQIAPQRGVRHFIARRIVSVEPTGEPLVTDRNNFCAGPVVMSGRPAAGGNDAGSAFTESWFLEYADIVREAIDDYQVEECELDRVEQSRDSLCLTLGQVRAVHAYIFAEYLMGYAIDGDLDPGEEEQVEQIANCLDELGWRPADRSGDGDHSSSL